MCPPGRGWRTEGVVTPVRSGCTSRVTRVRVRVKTLITKRSRRLLLRKSGRNTLRRAPELGDAVDVPWSRRSAQLVEQRLAGGARPLGDHLDPPVGEVRGP